MEGEKVVLKALYFDLHIQLLKEHYSRTNPKGAYKKIKEFLLARDFSHEQYSGYHSKFRTTDLYIFDLVEEIEEKLPWFKQCVNHFEATDIGPHHNLVQLFAKKFKKPEVV